MTAYGVKTTKVTYPVSGWDKITCSIMEYLVPTHYGYPNQYNTSLEIYISGDFDPPTGPPLAPAMMRNIILMSFHGNIRGVARRLPSWR